MFKPSGLHKRSLVTPLMESPDSGTTEDVSPGDVAPHRGQQEHYARIRMQILFFP